MTNLINIRCLPFAFFICQSMLGLPTDLIFKSLRQYISLDLQEIVCFSLKANSSRITMRNARLYTNVLELYRQCINMGIEKYFLIKKSFVLFVRGLYTRLLSLVHISRKHNQFGKEIFLDFYFFRIEVGFIYH
jgi:hypothetical protein